MTNSTDHDLPLEPGEPNEPLFDEALRKALAQAPDRSTLPDWRVRQAIIDHAHDAISASEELLTASRESTPWWRLAWWRERIGPTGAVPWGAAFATVAVGVLVTLMWQREPLPGAQLDERPVAAPAAPTPAAAPAPEPPKAGAAAAKEGARRPAAAPPAPAQLPPEALLPPVLLERAPPAPASAAAPVPPVSPEAPPASGQAAGPSGAQDFAAAPGAAASRPAPGADAAAAPQRRAQAAAAPPPAPAQPAEDRKRGAAGARQESAAEPAAPVAAAAAPLIPDFASLGRWTEMRVANVNGDVRVVPRAEAGELSLLMSSAAIMAVGAPPMRALPEWRVSLERKGQVLAVLEVARSQVRWTEGKLPPSTGAPPIESLDALRGALRQAMKAGATPRPEAPMPPVRAPRAEPAPPAKE